MHTIFAIKNSSVKAAVGDTDPLTEFGDAVDQVALTNAFDTTEWKPVSGRNQSEVSPLKQTVNLNVGDSLTEGELWDFLYKNHGKQGRIEVTPIGKEEPKIAAKVTFIAPAQLGGAVGANSSAAQLPVIGQADITRAPANGAGGAVAPTDGE